MKKISMLFTGTIFLAAILAFSSFTPLPPGPSANGQGSLTRPGDLQRRFAFHANTMPDGSVQGSGVLTITGGGRQIKFDINCLTVVGNEARMTGIITADTDFPVLIGTGCYFRVVDNGEGTNSSGDQITLLSLGLTPGFSCTNAFSTLLPIEGGNIQVKP